MHVMIGACKLFEVRHMKTTSERYSFDEMRHFIYSFPAALCPGSVPAFQVDSLKCGRNRYSYRVKNANGDLQEVVLTYGDAYLHSCDLGTFGGIDKLFLSAHPKMMLRNCNVTYDELVESFSLDKNELAEVVFKKFSNLVDSFLKIRSYVSFILISDCNSIENVSTPEVTSIEELMVWADLNGHA